MNLEYLRKYQFNSCLDIGAHLGNFYREMTAAKFNIDNWLLLEANKDCEIALQQIGVPYKICLLSDSVKILPYYRHKMDKTCTGNSYYRELTHHYRDDNIEIDYLSSYTLDSVVDKSFDLIKLDTQGSEIDILRGGIKTLSSAKLVIVETSIEPYNQNAPLQSEVIDFMKSNGFEKMKVIDDVFHIHQQDILFSQS